MFGNYFNVIVLVFMWQCFAFNVEVVRVIPTSDKFLKPNSNYCFHFGNSRLLALNVGQFGQYDMTVSKQNCTSIYLVSLDFEL